MRVLFVTLEFSAATFSGNGVYAQSQVRALSQLGHQVLVISARPFDCSEPRKLVGAVAVYEVPVSRWGQLDASAPWQEFAEGCQELSIVRAASEFQAEMVLGVDWTSLTAYRQLKPHLPDKPPFLYLNYRVFSRTASSDDLELVSRLEMEAVAEGIDTLVLSRSDAEYIEQHLLPVSCKHLKPKVLLPALRADMQQIPASNSAGEGGEGGSISIAAATASTRDAGMSAVQLYARQRNLLTCCVRLSPEKEPDRFVAIVEELSRRGTLQEHGLLPVLCGSANTDYAQGLRARLKAATPNAIIEDRFLGPAELAQLYRRTRLNIHPCSYDAFGMTIVEAASQGAPSLANAGGAIGALDLLSADDEEAFTTDMTASVADIADVVEAILGNPTRIWQCGIKAEAKARSWDERANAESLTFIMKTHMQQRQQGAGAGQHGMHGEG